MHQLQCKITANCFQANVQLQTAVLRSDTAAVILLAQLPYSALQWQYNSVDACT
jgi:hypothetical protein